MTPLKFEPILKTIVWGGEKIAPYKGIETEQKHIGESWELSGVAGNESVVAEGPLKGKTIAQLDRREDLYHTGSDQVFNLKLTGNDLYACLAVAALIVVIVAIG